MSNRPSPANNLLEALREERTAMQFFLTLLEEEQSALAIGAADKVAAGLPQKSQCIARLSRFALHRSEMLKSLRLPEGTGGIESLFALQPEARMLADEWRELMSVTRKAWRTNQENGALIAGRLHANVQALETLQQYTGRNPLYGSEGQPVNDRFTRLLGAA